MSIHVMEITNLNFPSRLATWKEVLLGGDQTHDGLDDCRDLRDIVAKLAEAEHALMPRVIDTSEDEKCTHSSTLLHIHKNAFQEWQEDWTPSCRNLLYYQKCVVFWLSYIYQYTLYFLNVARGEYFSKNQYFFTTTKNGPARDSRDTLSLVSLDSNISARTQKKGNFSAHGSNISART